MSQNSNKCNWNPNNIKFYKYYNDDKCFTTCATRFMHGEDESAVERARQLVLYELGADEPEPEEEEEDEDGEAYANPRSPPSYYSRDNMEGNLLLNLLSYCMSQK